MSSSAPQSTQQGATLIIALVLLVVLAFGSIVAARSAVNSDMIAKNLRSQNLALQAAEMALRWCEQELNALPTLVLNDNTITTEWRTAANWTNSGQTVPEEVIGTTVAYNTPPQCLIRRMSYQEAYGNVELPADAITPESRGINHEYLYFFRITARGYSPDYEVDDGNVVSGSEVWVQSTVRSIL